MGVVREDDGWRVPDELWTKLEPLLPLRPEHPLGCHNPRTPDRRAMDGILLVLRTGMQWRALTAAGVCGPSSAYRRFREWLEAGVFWEFWRQGLLMYEALGGIDGEWLAVACCAMGGSCLSGSWCVAPTRTTTNCCARGSTPSPCCGLVPRANNRRACVWMRATTMTRCDGSLRTLA